MKLEAVVDGRIYATDGRKVFVRKKTGEFVHLSTLPNPKSGVDRIRYNLKTGGIEARLRRLLTGRVHSVNVWPIEDDVLFANAYRSLFVSYDGGKSWKHSLELHESSGLRGVMPCGLCHKDGTVYLGEYIFDESANPRVLRTDDHGQNWFTHTELEGVRHIHSVQVDPYSDEIWITTGDRDDESIIGILREDEVEIVGTGSQRWRAVQPVFLRDTVLWGTDAPYKENNILQLPRSSIDSADTNIETLHTTTNPFYFGTVIGDWVVFSTNSSTAKDSTAPVGTTHESRTVATVWGASSHSDYQEWKVIGQYETKGSLARRIGLERLSANTYIFVNSCPTAGLVCNPFNSSDYDQTLINYPSESIADGIFNEPNLYTLS